MDYLYVTQTKNRWGGSLILFPGASDRMASLVARSFCSFQILQALVGGFSRPQHHVFHNRGEDPRPVLRTPAPSCGRAHKTSTAKFGGQSFDLFLVLPRTAPLRTVLVFNVGDATTKPRSRSDLQRLSHRPESRRLF